MGFCSKNHCEQQICLLGDVWAMNHRCVATMPPFFQVPLWINVESSRQDVLWSIWFEASLRGWFFISDVVMSGCVFPSGVYAFWPSFKPSFLSPFPTSYSPHLLQQPTHQVQLSVVCLFVDWSHRQSLFFFPLSLFLSILSVVLGRRSEQIKLWPVCPKSRLSCPLPTHHGWDETRVVVNKVLVRVSVLLPRESNRLAIGSIYFLFGRKVQVRAKLLWTGGWMSGACGSRGECCVFVFVLDAREDEGETRVHPSFHLWPLILQQ